MYSNRSHLIIYFLHSTFVQESVFGGYFKTLILYLYIGNVTKLFPYSVTVSGLVELELVMGWFFLGGGWLPPQASWEVPEGIVRIRRERGRNNCPVCQLWRSDVQRSNQSRLSGWGEYQAVGTL